MAEIEGWQKIIDGARQVVANWKPDIKIDPQWPKLKLNEICENLDSRRKPIEKSLRKSGAYPYYGASGIVDYVDGFIFNENLLLISEDGANLKARVTPIAFSISGKTWVNNHAHVLKFSEITTQLFIETYINSINIERFVTGSAQPKITQESLNNIDIPLPNLSIQKSIVDEIQEQQKGVDACKKLIDTYEARIREKIGEVWGE